MAFVPPPHDGKSLFPFFFEQRAVDGVKLLHRCLWFSRLFFSPFFFFVGARQFQSRGLGSSRVGPPEMKACFSVVSVDTLIRNIMILFSNPHHH